MDTHWLPCVRDLAPYLTPEVKQILEETGQPLPALLKVLDRRCFHNECKHHIFNTPLRKERNGQRYTENNFTRSICNCMCLIQNGTTQASIAEMFDVRLFWVQCIERKALASLREALDEKFYEEVTAS